MRIHEILFWNKGRAEKNHFDPQLDSPPAPFSNDLIYLSRAFTKDGRVKYLWYMDGLAGQPSEPAPSDTETELIPSGTPGPITASWQAEPPIAQYQKIR